MRAKDVRVDVGELVAKYMGDRIFTVDDLLAAVPLRELPATVQYAIQGGGRNPRRVLGMCLYHSPGLVRVGTVGGVRGLWTLNP